MSLALVLANPYGIVMSADRRLTATVIDEKNKEKVSFLLTDHEQKIFITKAGHGITYTGSSNLKDGTLTSCVIRDALLKIHNEPLAKEIAFIKQQLLNFSDGRNVILLGAEVNNGRNNVISTSLVSDSITSHINSNGNCLAFSGQNDTVKKLTDMFPVDYSSFPLQESINYLRFLNRSVAGIQHYAQISQTVSEDCNILVLQNTSARWISPPDSLC